MSNSAMFPAMQAAIELNILQLKLKGGPTERDFARLPEVGDLLAEKGDVLLFGGKKGEAAEIFNEVAWAIAVLSFAPGGIQIFGNRFVGRE